MLDFTSALYLGLRHASPSLPPWRRLTTGVPAALATPPAATEVAGGLAALQGAERAVLASSTLHLFWDLFLVLGAEDAAIHVDAGAYPIARWGVERAAALGVPVSTFAHHDPADLRRSLLRSRGRRPIVVADGFCPGFGAAPVREYLELARRCGGLLVLDDTQALGVLGAEPTRAEPFGRGGGGTPAWVGLSGPELVVGASLAKGLGVPMAVLSGSAELVGRYEAGAETRVHCSPPSAAALSAGQRTLAVNTEWGDVLRARLALLVRRFRARLARAGCETTGGVFPVQTVAGAAEPSELHERLRRLGVAAVLHRRPAGQAVSFLLRADHTLADVDLAAGALAVAAATNRRRAASFAR